MVLATAWLLVVIYLLVYIMPEVESCCAD